MLRISRLAPKKTFFSCSRLRQERNNIENSDTRHFKKPDLIWENPISHEVWSTEEVQSVKETHMDTKTIGDKAAFATVKMLRWSFDTFSGYRFGKLSTSKVLNRMIFLETVAGVPGFAAGIIRHLNSLRKMQRDYGWIHTLLAEAENERMHLLTFIKLKQPGLVFRTAVLITQGLFMNGFFLAYLISPKFCHRLVGYLEEEAVHTYTDILRAIDDGRLKEWQSMPPPEIGAHYWRLKPDATMRDLLLAVRADEANHRDVNHTFASIPKDQKNPFLKKTL